MSDRYGGWIQTFSGRQFWPLDARPDEIEIEDIAHALANTARFGGHTLGFYSVAQHSVHVSHTCRPENALWGLLHDAAEAYLGDIPRPIKHGPGFESFPEMEADLMAVIRDRFNLVPSVEPSDVKRADAIVLSTERRDLLRTVKVNEGEWLHGAQPELPLSYTIWPLDPAHSEALFLERFAELTMTPAERRRELDG